MAITKRAVSPLIATVLLISFAVALGAVVMAFTSRAVEDKVNKGCLDLALADSGICYDSNNQLISLSLENSGKSDIDSLNIWVIANGVFKNDLKEPIKAGGKLKKDLQYDYAAYGDIKGITIISSVKKRDQIVPCINNVLDIKQISSC